MKEILWSDRSNPSLLFEWKDRNLKRQERINKALDDLKHT